MGGTSRSEEAKKLARGINIIVATPGRLLDHLQVCVVHIDGLVQDCSISSALALEILQACANPLICEILYIIYYHGVIFPCIS